MELELKHVPFYATSWDVKKAFGEILHSDVFYNPTDERARPMYVSSNNANHTFASAILPLSNFKVQLNDGLGIQNNGTGTLTLPDRHIGQKLVKLSKSNVLSVKVQGRRIGFSIWGKRPPMREALTLERTPYLEPDIEEDRERILDRLVQTLAIEKVQFGVFYRAYGDSPAASRRFSIEYELARKKGSNGYIRIEYEHKLIRAKVRFLIYSCLP